MALVPVQLWDIAVHLKEQVIDIYADEGVGLPERRYISEGGPPAFDCEELAIELRRTYRGLPGQEGVDGRSLCSGIRSAEFHVWIARCTSVPQDSGDPPTPAVIETYSHPIYTDAWFLPSRLQTRAADGDLASPCNEVLVGQGLVVAASGGFGGTNLQVDWQIGTI